MAKLIDARELTRRIRDWDKRGRMISERNPINCILDIIDSMPDMSPDSVLMNKYAVKKQIDMAIKALRNVNEILNEDYYPEEKR